MDNSDSDQSERRNSTNTEYVPTKCRVTKPPPPKPATNPLQFIRVAPCPLLVKAKEQIKKVEEIKKERKDVREEAEDWQSKLDNWKSCRRKRQEHIIERVVEVKKIEQEQSERSRRKAKTFNEMMQERGRGRHKFPIPVYDDDSNDLSDLGLGAASTSESTVKHTETDSYDSTEPNHNPSTENNHITNGNTSNNEHVFRKPPEAPPKKEIRPILKTRVSIRDESLIFANQEQEISKSKELNEAQTVLPKGEIFKRKELFNKPLEINTYESNSARRLSEDFCNAQSIKQRLQNLEKVTENPNKNDNDKVQVLSIKERLSNFNKLNDSSDSRNNNDTQQKPNKISDYLLKSTIAKNNNQYNNDWKKDERSSSPETVFMNKLNMFDRELDTMMYGKCASDNGLEDSYAPSTSSTEVMALSSDREDSGIHTADVSCSVSQADEPMEDELASNTIPICIEKLQEQQDYETPKISPNAPNVVGYLTKDDIINSTMEFLESVRRNASENSDVYQSPLTNHNQINQQLNEWDSGTMVEDTLTMNVQLQNTQPSATYENKRNLTLDFSNDFVVDPLSPSNMVEPPKVKPPPPPPSEDEEPLKRLNSTKRFKKKLHIKRSSFLGLESPTDDQINPELIMDKPPDINTFLQMEKTMFRKTHDGLSKVESQDSGLDIDRERLSGETWDNSHTRHDSEQTNSVASEDEVSKKEREIIELVEKEEQSQSRDPHADYTHRQNNVATLNNHNLMQFEPSLGSEKFQSPYFPPTSDFLDDQDSEVLKVEQELRQLEREELERQRENMLFRESRAKAQLKNNRHSMESIIDEIYPTYHPEDVNNYRKSMPELQHIPLDYRRSNEMVTYPDIYGGPELDLEMQYRKSMPNIHGYPAVSEVHKSSEELRAPGYRKSMPELQKEPHRSFAPAPPVRQAIPTGKPLKRYSPKQDNKPRMLTKPSMQALSAIPRNKYIQNDKWLQPRQNPEVKSYNQHWLYQEAELRRIQDQQKNLSSRNWPPQHHRHEKHLPDAIINTLTERVQSRLLLNDRNQPMLIRPDASSTREFNQNSYLDHSQTLGHALPMSYQTPAQFEDAQDRILSVSGKKKCSYCGNELGRGAAMIIESLCLFYHMECFKCCVCHMQLGDGLMGTDVRVRNQKLHCHNCYSSDDGVKFSCV